MESEFFWLTFVILLFVNILLEPEWFVEGVSMLCFDVLNIHKTTPSACVRIGRTFEARMESRETASAGRKAPKGR